MMQGVSYRRMRSSKTRGFGFLLAMLLAVGFLGLTPASGAHAEGAFVVNSTGDDVDAKYGDGVCATAMDTCTLRAAITESNYHTGPDTVAFAIPGEGVKTIKLTDALPPLRDTSGPTTIDGYTQLGSSPNTAPLASNAKIMVQIEGGGEDQFGGLQITSPGNVVRGLALYNMRGAIRLFGLDAHDNRVVGNFIGTDATGRYDAKFVPYGYASGVRLAYGASNNLIGRGLVADRNVIAGNASHGVALYDAGTESNVIVGNLIGLAPSGKGRLANKAVGVDINYGPSYNVVGGTLKGQRNVISGNDREGVEISHHYVEGRPENPFPTGNRVIGNFIGTGLAGEGAPEYARNRLDGVHLVDGAQNNLVTKNVIGNNGKSGVAIDGLQYSYTKGNKVYANRIGISRGGRAIPNGRVGVLIFAGAQGSKIGPNNVISNNPVGIRVSGSYTDFNTITRNSVHQNARLGIDLPPFGRVNKNDLRDADSGANQQQNYPVLTKATTSSGTTKINAVLSSAANKRFIIQFFSNPKGTKQGKVFIGHKAVRTGASGKVNFTFKPTKAVRPGRTITATATAPSGDTSEFSLPRTVQRP